MIVCKRAYVPASEDDGYRVLVDRLWPRNCPKARLPLNEWLKDLAPTTELRRAFKSGEIDFEQFGTRYRAQLAAQPGHWWKLLEIAEKGKLTLIYAAHDEVQNNARVLAQWLEDELDRHAESSSPVCYADRFTTP